MASRCRSRRVLPTPKAKRKTRKPRLTRLRPKLRLCLRLSLEATGHPRHAPKFARRPALLDTSREPSAEAGNVAAVVAAPEVHAGISGRVANSSHNLRRSFPTC